MPTILAIETSTDACSVALYCSQDMLISRYQIMPRKHTELIFPMLDSVLHEAEITMDKVDALAFGRGPGAFTGVRIASAVIQGIALTDQLPILAVSSLATIAQGIYRRKKVSQVLVANDARMKEVYWGYFSLQAGIMQIEGEEQLSSPDKVPIPDGKIFLAGSGFRCYPEIFANRDIPLTYQDKEALPEAQDIIPIALSLWKKKEIINIADALPIYLRNNVVHNNLDNR